MPGGRTAGIVAADRPERASAGLAKVYGRPDPKRSVLQLITTAVPLVVLWLVMEESLKYSYWLTLLLAVPTAGFLVRLFMIQHDCGHGAFFKSRTVNDMLGRVLGVFTLTPYGYWRKTHAIHHATSGNLSRRGIGDVDVLTVKEYLARPFWKRLAYRLYRNPIVFFGIGPTYLFVIKHRLPSEALYWRKRVLLSVLTTNVAIAALATAMMLWFGVAEFLMVQAPITFVASSIGVWLFFVQHQFEHTYWEKEEDWNFHEAAIHGSSYYDLPAVLRWFTANIGVHHVHHLCSRIPNYRLRECLTENPALRGVNRLTLLESAKCVRLTLWDEERKKLVGFRHLRSLRQTTRPVEPMKGAGKPE